MERISAEDLKALAVGSAALIGSVARDAADQARHLADRRRARKADRGTPPRQPAQEPAAHEPPVRGPGAPRRRPPGRRFRFRRRWVVVPVVVLVLVLLAVTTGILALIGFAFGLI